MKPERKNQAIDITDLYTMKIGVLWKSLKQEHISLWMLCIYFFFEYIRPQKLYPVLDVLPWGQLSLTTAIITGFLDPSARWVSNVQNRVLLLFVL